MEDIKEKIKEELGELIEEGQVVLRLVSRGKSDPVSIRSRYQSWYTRSLYVVKQLIPERYQEFQEQYSTKKSDLTIIHYLHDLGKVPYKDSLIDPFADEKARFKNNLLNTFKTNFIHQITILKSAQDRIDSILSDIEGILQYDLFDNELEAADELLKNGYLRAAGALASVSLEAYLAKVVDNHNLKITKKKSSISDYNNKLKENNIYDNVTWRFIQRLGDIRKLCVHKKECEPTKDEIYELIEGVKKVIKTIF